MNHLNTHGSDNDPYRYKWTEMLGDVVAVISLGALLCIGLAAASILDPIPSSEVLRDE